MFQQTLLILEQTIPGLNVSVCNPPQRMVLILGEWSFGVEMRGMGGHLSKQLSASQADPASSAQVKTATQ